MSLVSEHSSLPRYLLFFFFTLILIHSGVSLSILSFVSLSYVSGMSWFTQCLFTYSPVPTQGGCEGVLVSCLPGRVERHSRSHPKNILIPLDGSFPPDSVDLMQNKRREQLGRHNHYEFPLFLLPLWSPGCRTGFRLMIAFSEIAHDLKRKVTSKSTLGLTPASFIKMLAIPTSE